MWGGVWSRDVTQKDVIFALTWSVSTLATNNGSVIHLRAFLGLE